MTYVTMIQNFHDLRPPTSTPGQNFGFASGSVHKSGVVLSSGRGSKERRPSQNSPRVTSKREANVSELNFCFDYVTTFQTLSVIRTYKMFVRRE
ncbi:hypothetical protein AVEN_221431-1 [Araneus ventricosus]|uniref:Uncharacterized protein n=1 Tax=Araneus ventricosus TaxID=182803 RepID=A0A4Y2MQ87_ARAVE|nr:hypothetical protein AVEN_221431-1 [Araneus ventricosus]